MAASGVVVAGCGAAGGTAAAGLGAVSSGEAGVVGAAGGMDGAAGVWVATGGCSAAGAAGSGAAVGSGVAAAAGSAGAGVSSPNSSFAAFTMSSSVTCDLTKYLSAPKVSARVLSSACPRAVSMMTLVCLRPSVLRRMSSISKPLIRGIMTSEITRSGNSFLATTSAVSPSGAVTISYPSACKRASYISRRLLSSSTKRIFAICPR